MKSKRKQNNKQTNLSIVKVLKPAQKKLIPTLKTNKQQTSKQIILLSVRSLCQIGGKKKKEHFPEVSLFSLLTLHTIDSVISHMAFQCTSLEVGNSILDFRREKGRK